MGWDIESRFIGVFIDISAAFRRNKSFTFLRKCTCLEHGKMGIVVESCVGVNEGEENCGCSGIEDG